MPDRSGSLPTLNRFQIVSWSFSKTSARRLSQTLQTACPAPDSRANPFISSSLTSEHFSIHLSPPLTFHPSLLPAVFLMQSSGLNLEILRGASNFLALTVSVKESLRVLIRPIKPSTSENPTHRYSLTEASSAAWGTPPLWMDTYCTLIKLSKPWKSSFWFTGFTLWPNGLMQNDHSKRLYVTFDTEPIIPAVWAPEQGFSLHVINATCLITVHFFEYKWWEIYQPWRQSVFFQTQFNCGTHSGAHLFQPSAIKVNVCALT